MSQAKIFEGTWAELSAHTDEFGEHRKLTLIVPETIEHDVTLYQANLAPRERVQALDALAKRNRHIPALPAAAFDRESLYADDDELNRR